MIAYESGSNPDDKVIVDFFSDPFLFVVERKAHNKTSAVADSLVKEYEDFLFARCPIKFADQLTSDDLKNKNIFFIGHNFSSRLLMDGIKKIPLAVSGEKVEINESVFPGNNLTFQAIFASPFNPQKNVIIYSTNNPKNFAHQICFPWRDGFEKLIIKVNQ